MYKEDFSLRLALLRTKMNISARDMSLSLGQSSGYINNIENNVNLPSMTMFFYICEYLEVTPAEFFDIESACPQKTNQLVELTKGMSSDKIDLVINIVREMKK